MKRRSAALAASELDEADSPPVTLIGVRFRRRRCPIRSQARNVWVKQRRSLRYREEAPRARTRALTSHARRSRPYPPHAPTSHARRQRPYPPRAAVSWSTAMLVARTPPVGPNPVALPQVGRPERVPCCFRMAHFVGPCPPSSNCPHPAPRRSGTPYCEPVQQVRPATTRCLSRT